MIRASSFLAGLAALAAFTALVLQAVLIVQTMREGGASTGAALWRFFGYFTILTNIVVMVVAGAMAVGGRLASARVKLCAFTAIVAVGLVYSLALRAMWNPTGWQAVADHALHDASPLLFVAAWLTGAHGGLVWRDIAAALVFPFAYFVYAIARGLADGWYAYWFLDPTELGWGGMAASIVVLLCVFALVAAMGVALDRQLGRARRAAV